MPGEERCQVCREPHTEARPADVVFALPQRVEMEFTGPEEVLRQDHVREQVLNSYKSDLEIMVGLCLYCRIEGRKFDYALGKCLRRFRWIRVK